METNGPIPFRVAAAYATAPKKVTSPPAVSQPAGTTIKGVVDRFEPSADLSRVHQLVAGKVSSGINRGVDFDGDPLPPAAAPPKAKTTPQGISAPLQFHTVSAARVEAATGVALGQTLDIQA